jgi:hypothetical protein
MTDEAETVTVVKITAPHFTAALVVTGARPHELVTQTAPILDYMLGWSGQQVRVHCGRCSWIASICPADEQETLLAVEGHG